MATYVVYKVETIESQYTVDADSAEEAINFAQDDNDWEMHEQVDVKYTATFEEWGTV